MYTFTEMLDHSQKENNLHFGSNFFLHVVVNYYGTHGSYIHLKVKSDLTELNIFIMERANLSVPHW